MGEVCAVWGSFALTGGVLVGDVHSLGEVFTAWGRLKEVCTAWWAACE